MPDPTPRPSRAEEVALFRLSVVGDLLARDLAYGELDTLLEDKARERYRPPGATRSRTYHKKTLQGWYYAARKGFVHLKPAARTRGHALALDAEQRQMLADMRREHPSAAAELILDEAVRHGIIPKDAVSEQTLRRLLQDLELTRGSLNRAARRTRRRWAAEAPCDIWHADVCHLWLHGSDGRKYKIYVHAILDDCSRFILALDAREHEREVDLLIVLCGALLRFPAPKVFYVDNGSCYRGEILQLVGERLGFRVVHAKPYDPEARGKQERFWRTMRQRCTDHLATHATRQQVNAALLTWLDEDYHRRPHAGLLGETPSRRFQRGLGALPQPLEALQLAQALETTLKPQVRKDATFQLSGQTWEVSGHHLAGKRIEVVLDPLTDAPIRASYQGRPVVIGRCDPVANKGRGRPAPTPAPAPRTTPFDPIAGLLARARKDPDHE